MNENERFESGLSRLLGASQARANPAVLARARSRLAASAPVPSLVRVLGLRSTLVAAVGLFVVATLTGVVWMVGDARQLGQTSLVSSVLGDDGSYGVPGGAAAPAAGAGATDSGQVAP